MKSNEIIPAAEAEARAEKSADQPTTAQRSDVSTEPRTIIHFTNSSDALRGILSVGFKIKYCRETIDFGGVIKSIRVPVVSFCDIPIRLAGENMAKYGPYALGLTRSWAVAHGLNRVNYLERGSSAAPRLLRALDAGIENSSNATKGDPLMDALDQLRYIKNYEGELHRADGTVVSEYYFGDESEWRYALQTERFYEFLYMEEMAKKPGVVETMQRLIEDKRLLFAARDVRYILIAKEDERLGMEAHIRSLEARYTKEGAEDLVSKIRTLEQIT